MRGNELHTPRQPEDGTALQTSKDPPPGGLLYRVIHQWPAAEQQRPSCPDTAPCAPQSCTQSCSSTLKQDRYQHTASTQAESTPISIQECTSPSHQPTHPPTHPHPRACINSCPSLSCTAAALLLQVPTSLIPHPGGWHLHSRPAADPLLRGNCGGPV
jgi:hypothetical protein